MGPQYSYLFDEVEKHKQLILEAEEHIWKHPESGYKEWKTHAYLKEKYEALGYTLIEAGNIPGFYTDIDTGRPGPKIAVFGELDSLVIPTHPEADPETGAVHACGHNCQSAALLGLAAALKAPHALDGLCGSIRLIAVPAEEAIELDFRQKLRESGVIRYKSGKIEFMYRGYLDGVDMAIMVHTASGNKKFGCTPGSNGCILKTATFTGKSAHAGGSPHLGRNALYAATNAITAANALRETFRDEDCVRFHPIITRGGNVVNAIPDDVAVESYVRGATMQAMAEANERINRAFAAAAASMGCKVRLQDDHGMAPRYNDPHLGEVFHRIAAMLYPEEELDFTAGTWDTGCSDMGDISMVMPAAHPHCAGAVGAGHGTDYRIADPYTACVVSAKVQIGTLYALLCNEAEQAQYVLSHKKTAYPSMQAYFEAIDRTAMDREAVLYNEDGSITLQYKNESERDCSLKESHGIRL